MLRSLPRPMLGWLALACAFAAAAGLWLGSRPAPTETEVISAGARAYAAETGGDPQDCVGVPGQAPPVWIKVICKEGAAAPWHRAYDRYGRQLALVPES